MRRNYGDGVRRCVYLRFGENSLSLTTGCSWRRYGEQDSYFCLHLRTLIHA